MSTPVVTVGPDETVEAAVRLIERAQVKRLPVVDDDGSLVGIVSRRDLIRIHRRSDDDIRREIVEDVLRRSLWLDTGAMQVEVTDGVVELRGRVDRRTAAIFTAALTERIPGVLRAIDKLSWQVDDIVESHPGRDV